MTTVRHCSSRLTLHLNYFVHNCIILLQVLHLIKLKEVWKLSKPTVFPEKQPWQTWCWLQLINRPPRRKWNNAPLCFVEVRGTGWLHIAAESLGYVSAQLTLPSDRTAAGPPLLLDSNTHWWSMPTHASHCLGFCVPASDLFPSGRLSPLTIIKKKDTSGLPVALHDQRTHVTPNKDLSLVYQNFASCSAPSMAPLEECTCSLFVWGVCGADRVCYLCEWCLVI